MNFTLNLFLSCSEFYYGYFSCPGLAGVYIPEPTWNSSPPPPSLSAFGFSVCLSGNKLQVTIFDQGTEFLENMIQYDRVMGKKLFFVFQNFHFWRFYGPFCCSFPLCICHRSPRSTYKHRFWHVCSDLQT